MKYVNYFIICNHTFKYQVRTAPWDNNYISRFQAKLLLFFSDCESTKIYFTVFSIPLFHPTVRNRITSKNGVFRTSYHSQTVRKQNKTIVFSKNKILSLDRRRDEVVQILELILFLKPMVSISAFSRDRI